MRAFFLFGLLLFAGSLTAPFLSAQNLSLKGTIVAGATAEPLEYTTVTAFTADSVLVDGTVTDGDGAFRLELERGNYLLQFEFLGFLTKRMPIELSKALDLGNIELEADSMTLKEVEVRAEKSQMNLLLDKKVFNMGQDALARGGSANQVLEQLPSVRVSAEGVVSLRGNSGVNILINGRPSALADNNALASIPAESIEKIEIITNPSARYEAEGTAGIINIILKKEQQKGYGGTAGLNIGYPADHQANLNVNWRRKKYNAFVNLGALYSDYRGESTNTRKSFLPELIENLEQQRDQDRNDKALSAFTGIDYHFDEKNTLSASYSIFHVVNTDSNPTSYRYSNEEDELTQQWEQQFDYLEPGTYHQIDLGYTNTFNTEGKKLSVYFRNDLWNEEESSAIRINESFPSDEELLHYRTGSIESSRDHLLQVDYETPLGEHGRLEAGLRGETRIISADYQVELAEGSDWSVLPGFDNQLDYYERIGSAYAQYGYQKEAFGVQLGLRNEYTIVQVENEVEEKGNFRKMYNRLFPSFSFNYRFTEQQNIQLSYSRRIRRPSFWQLNPFQNLSDPTTLFVGNPDMDPAYTDRLELNFVQQSEKLTFNPAVYASRTLDYFEIARDQQVENLFDFATGTIINQPINLSHENRYGIEITTNYRPTDALTLSGEVNYYGYQQRGAFGDRNFDFDFATWNGGLRFQLDLPGGLSFQSRLTYQARQKNVQMMRRATSNVVAGISKQWNDRFTLTLSTRGPNWGRVDVYRPSFTFTERGRWTGWRVGLNLQYRFEKGAKAESRESRGSIR